MAKGCWPQVQVAWACSSAQKTGVMASQAEARPTLRASWPSRYPDPDPVLFRNPQTIMDLINSIFGGGDKRPRDQNSPVEAGDELIIPFFDQDSEDVLITVKWTQSFSEREAKYYVLTAQNLTLNRAKVVIYVAAEWYDYSDEKNPNHITQIGDFVEDEGHRITVDDRLRYGQKNKDGECRFLVYHDTERNPYQHRFLETTPQAVSARRAQDLAGSLGLGTTAGTVFDFGRSQLGDPLRSF